MATDPYDTADSAQPPAGNDADEAKSWGHQVAVGAALMLVSLFFLPEGFGALRGESGSFLFRADDGAPDVLFGGMLIAMGTAMLLGGTFLLIKGLRKRKAEAGGPADR